MFDFITKRIEIKREKKKEMEKRTRKLNVLHQLQKNGFEIVEDKTGYKILKKQTSIRTLKVRISVKNKTFRYVINLKQRGKQGRTTNVEGNLTFQELNALYQYINFLMSEM